ncbi:Ig-like domain-containing protein [Anaerocolumna xylanovorans]|uniref:Ig-like domain (Group 2) n=1 Tax=Anaerocolumna xylanovorans DSM 12503 TaxID=1121345 RepID=A0A1M7Y4G4_9FIRM|nr:Ig-like domain-containing protein [Anaerocolumna xylanovorans]SHO47132.1 Ig-like domain (group 2) [Anaerocolumna xylanovorans DSM 12503]
MKKNFFKKKLASALALALVVASVSPISASAATAAKIVDKGTSKATTVLYVDKVSYGKSAVNFDLSKTYAGTKYTWTVSDSKKATIGAKTGYVVAKAPGVVTVKVAAKTKKGKTSTFTQKVTIRQRAKTVAVGEDFTLNSGETKALKAALTPANSTDAVKYVSDKEAVATVDAKTGVVTAVEAGEATITVYAKAASTAPDSSQWNVTDTVKVTVPLGVASIKQTGSTELAVTFNSKIESGKVAAKDFAIVNDATKAVIGVKDAVADGTNIVKVTTFAGMTDGKTYTVTYDKKDTQFTATDGKIATLTISPATIAFQTETEIKVSTADANGVVLNTYSYSDTSAEPKIEFTLSDVKGYTSGKNLYLFNIGDTAKAKAVYHTYKYDAAGQEVGAITTELTITAVDKTAVGVSKQEYTVAKDTPNWNKYTANTQLAVGDTSMKLFLRVLKTDNNYAGYGDYTFDSSNYNVLLATTSGTGLAADLIPVSAGSAYVLVKDKDGKVVWSLAVTVLEERKAASLLLDKESVTLSKAFDGVVAVDKKVITASLKDQFGKDKDFAAANINQPELYSGDIATKPNVVMNSDGTIEITPTLSSVAGKTYSYKVVYGSLTRVFTVSVVEPTGTTYGYQVERNKDTIDTVYVDASTANKSFTIKVGAYQGGALAKYADIKEYTIKKGSDTVATQGAGFVAAKAVTFTALDVTTSPVTKQAAGSYTIELKYIDLADGTTKTITSGFAVVDTQSPVTVKHVASSVSGAADVDAALKKAFEFSYEGNKIENVDLAFQYDTGLGKDVYTYANGSTNFVVIKSVKVLVKIGTKQIPVSVDINQTITYTN